MHVLAILLVLLIGGFVIVAAASIPFSSEHGSGRKRALGVLASTLMVVGAAGFFGTAFSAVGGLNWLPESFEWPVGYAGGVVSIADKVHVVPHTPSGRVQVYDVDWRFIRGWHVDAAGGNFKLLLPDANRIDVITARGRWHYVFDMEGNLISKSTYAPARYDSFPDQGESMIVPTAPWLWTFSHPIISWAALAIGMGTLIVLSRLKRKAEAK